MIIFILVLVDFIITLTLGIMILSNNYRSRTNRAFFAFSVFSSLWTIVNYLSVTTIGDISHTKLYIQLVLLVTVGAISSFVVFCIYYPNDNYRMSMRTWIWYVVTILVGLSSFLPTTVVSVNIENNVVKPVFGPSYPIYGIYLLANIILALAILIKKYRKAVGIDAVRIQYLFLGFGLFVIFPVITNLLFVAILQLTDFVIFGPFAILILDGFIVYSILRHKFLNIRVVVGEMIYFFLLSLVPVSFFYIVVVVETKLFGSIFSLESSLLGLVEAPLFTFLFLSSSKTIKKFLNRTFIYVEYDPIESRNSFFNKTNNILSLAKILDVLKDTLERSIRPNITDIVIYDEKNKPLIAPINKKFDSELMPELKSIAHNQILFINELEHEKFKPSHYKNAQTILKLMKDNNYEVILVMSKSDSFKGFIGLGTKSNQSAYVTEDLNYLSVLTTTLSVAIERAILYLERLNSEKRLQEKVDAATLEIRRQKEKLQQKYDFEKDMMGIMGHELRTPMTVAKGMTELLYSKALKGETDGGYVKEKTQKIYDSIIKEGELIETMLSTAHVDNNKINLQLTNVNILDVVEYAVNAFHRQAEEKGLKFIYEKPKEVIPTITSDPGRLQEVVNNLVSNAVKYTKTGQIKVSLELKDKRVLVHVQDTGIGIPVEEIKNLGKKFYRIHQHLDDDKQVVRAGGTGLGLYVVKGLLAAMGGELLVQSVYGKGSTFSMDVPINYQPKDRKNIFVTDKPVDTKDMFQKLGFKEEAQIEQKVMKKDNEYK
jgi:signal transduction histidine kinase